MVAGAVLASVLVNTISLTSSFWILGAGCCPAALACIRGLRGLDDASRRRTETLERRLATPSVPITQGTPQLALEQLASASQECRLPSASTSSSREVRRTPSTRSTKVASSSTVTAAVAHLEAGDGFGERGLLDNAPRNATVTTEVDTALLRIDGAVLLDVLEQAPMLRTALNHSLSGRGVVEESTREPALIDDPRWANA